METTNEKIIIDLQLMIKIEPLLLMCPNYPKTLRVKYAWLWRRCKRDVSDDDDDDERPTKRQKLGM